MLELQLKRKAQRHGFQAPTMLCRNLNCINEFMFSSIRGSCLLDFFVLRSIALMYWLSLPYSEFRGDVGGCKAMLCCQKWK
jgi:hypothetical protein